MKVNNKYQGDSQMGQKKIDRTKAWEKDQIDIEWTRRTEQALIDIKAKNEAKNEAKSSEDKSESDGEKEE